MNGIEEYGKIKKEEGWKKGKIEGKKEGMKKGIEQGMDKLIELLALHKKGVKTN